MALGVQMDGAASPQPRGVKRSRHKAKGQGGNVHLLRCPEDLKTFHLDITRVSIQTHGSRLLECHFYAAQRREFSSSFSKIKKGGLFRVADVKIAAERIIIASKGGKVKRS